MKWAVELKHYSLSHRNLVDLLHAIGLRLLEPPYEGLFTSNRIASMSSAEEVWSEAKRIRQAFRGSSGVDPSFQLGSVVDLSSGYNAYIFGQITSQVSVVATATGTVTVTTPIRTPEEVEAERQRQEEADYQSHLKTQRERLVSSLMHSSAEKVMSLVAVLPQTGETLYKCYELMEGHPNNRKTFQAHFDISADEFKRFADFVHNPAVSGDLARHAYHDPPKTANPMDVREATGFVRTLADKWLASISLDTETQATD